MKTLQTENLPHEKMSLFIFLEMITYFSSKEVSWGLTVAGPRSYMKSSFVFPAESSMKSTSSFPGGTCCRSIRCARLTQHCTWPRTREPLQDLIRLLLIASHQASPLWQGSTLPVVSEEEESMLKMQFCLRSFLPRNVGRLFH